MSHRCRVSGAVRLGGGVGGDSSCCLGGETPNPHSSSRGHIWICALAKNVPLMYQDNFVAIGFVINVVWVQVGQSVFWQGGPKYSKPDFDISLAQSPNRFGCWKQAGLLNHPLDGANKNAGTFDSEQGCIYHLDIIDSRWKNIRRNVHL